VSGTGSGTNAPGSTHRTVPSASLVRSSPFRLAKSFARCQRRSPAYPNRRANAGFAMRPHLFKCRHASSRAACASLLQRLGLAAMVVPNGRFLHLLRTLATGRSSTSPRSLSSTAIAFRTISSKSFASASPCPMPRKHWKGDVHAVPPCVLHCRGQVGNRGNRNSRTSFASRPPS